MKRHTKQRITGLLAVCLTFTAAVYGREGNPAAYRNGDRLCVRLPITAGIDLPANGQLTVTPVVSNGENQILLAPVVFTGRIREKVDERRNGFTAYRLFPKVFSATRSSAAAGKIRRQMRFFSKVIFLTSRGWRADKSSFTATWRDVPDTGRPFRR